jgi:histidinol-phosphate aminotransferase
VAEYFRSGRRVFVLRTFSKIYGLAGLRIGYGVGDSELVREVAKVRRAFDVTSAGQAAALASLGDDDELLRRREEVARERGRVVAALVEAGFDVAGPAVANFAYAETGDDVAPLFDALLREGVIVRPLAGFGAPQAIRVTVGTPEENAIFADALARARSAAASGVT